MARRIPRALIYGDVNLNVIDGSAIWAQSTVETFARAGCRVTLLLRTRVQMNRLLGPLERLAGVKIARPFEDRLMDGLAGDRLTVGQATAIMRRLDEQERFDIILVRGFQLAVSVVEDGGLSGRLWTYLTDIPQSVASMDQDTIDRLAEIVDGSRYLLCQTEELRSFLEGTVPAACGRSVVFAPVVPVPDFPLPPPRVAAGTPLRLVYSGKFAPMWNTLEMTRLPSRLADRGIQAELHAIGDKIHVDPSDPAYNSRMRNALESTPGVVWHGGQTRQQAMRMCAEADLGLSWRNRALDASLELSTKVLEYGSVGLPVVLNRTPMHEALLGVDYPFFARTEEDVVRVVAQAATEPSVYAEAAARCATVAERFHLDRAVERVQVLLDRAFPVAQPLPIGSRQLRVGIASHDLKFFSRILSHLRALPELEIRVDHWPTLTSHDAAASQALVDWADVVMCEWFGPNAVWYSANRRPDQRLVVRLHRFEIYRSWPRQAVIEQIDQVICVSQHYARLALERTEWPAEKVTVIPNLVDVAEFDRPKLEGARFHLGLIGVAPARKRMDIAIDILARLRSRDPRYQLFAKTKLPWDYDWIWSSEEERAHFDTVLRRSQTDPLLRGAVVFDELSTSDDESFHLAPAEGMASRAVPVIRDWAGAESIYDGRWIHRGADSMADAIAEIAEAGRWESEGQIAQEQARDSFDLGRVTEAWLRVLISNPPASETSASEMEAIQATAEPAHGPVRDRPTSASEG